jgi:hypothetical protein
MLEFAMPLLSRYRITQPTMALFLEEGRHVVRCVPSGAVISLDSVEGNRLVEVEWCEQKIRMFAQDIRSRGEKIEI